MSSVCFRMRDFDTHFMRVSKDGIYRWDRLYGLLPQVLDKMPELVTVLCDLFWHHHSAY